MRNYFIVICLILVTTWGCADTQVRHLASDVALIKPMQSTRQDVLLYLGEPDGHRSVSADVEEYVYHEDKRGSLKRTPLFSSWTDPDGYEMVVVTLNGDLVTGCEFRVFDKDDLDLINSYTWEEVQ